MEIVGLSDEKLTTTITGLEMFRKLPRVSRRLATTSALCCVVFERDEIERGQVLAVPGTRFIPTPRSRARSMS